MTDHKKLVADIITMQAERDELDEAIRFKKEKLAADLYAGEHLIGDNESGYVKAIVYQHKTFNEGYGKQRRPDLWEKAKETKEVVTSAGAKAKLSTEEYAEFQKPSDGLSVKLEVIND